MKTQEIKNRFRLFDSDNQAIIGKFNDLKSIYHHLLTIEKHLEDNHCFIDCSVDDIEVTVDEFMKAWANGERPQDLQMF